MSTESERKTHSANPMEMAWHRLSAMDKMRWYIKLGIPERCRTIERQMFNCSASVLAMIFVVCIALYYRPMSVIVDELSDNDGYETTGIAFCSIEHI